MRITAIPLVVGLTLAFATLLAEGADRLRVFVTADLPVRDARGVIDPQATNQMQDSVKDFDSWALRKFRLVHRREDADVVLVVRGRGIDRATKGSTAVAKPLAGGAVGAVATRSVMHTFWVSADVVISDQRRETFIGKASQRISSSAGAWHACADEIGKALREWTAANRKEIAALLAAHR